MYVDGKLYQYFLLRTYVFLVSFSAAAERRIKGRGTTHGAIVSALAVVSC